MPASGSQGASGPSRRVVAHDGLEAALEIVGLWTLAVLQPLLQLIGGEAPFLLHHRPDTVDLIVTIVALALGVPLLLVLLEAVVGRFLGSKARHRAHFGVLAILVGLLILGMLRKAGDPFAAWALLPVIGGLLWAAMEVLSRWPILTAGCRLLAAALPIVVVLFWTSPGARAARLTAAAGNENAPPGSRVEAPASAQDPPPVVWVIFDELPLLSIVDADLGIDREVFPNLAAFADRATWYRNATTVWSSTAESVVSMLTGTIAEPRTPPTRDRYPNNLLSWLEPTHQVRSLEMVTSLAPPTAVDLLPRPPRGARLAGLLSDAAILTAHILAPPSLTAALPAVDKRWGDFADSRVVRLKTDQTTTTAPPNRWSFALADARDDQFADFLTSIETGERPGLYFVHLMLPHMPFRYLPSGRVYGGRPAYDKPSEAWLEDEWFALQTYQRHLLQAAFVDRLVGNLVTRLEAVGIWEQAIVVITSDHGVSHWPGQDRRLPTATEHPEDILRVPLLIKAPHQVAGRIDDAPAPTVGILPTIAALIGSSPLPWPHDGTALLAARDAMPSRWLHHPQGEPLSFDTTATPDLASLERKLDLFDPQDGPWRWTRIGPYRSLVGETLETLAVPPTPRDCRAEVDQLTVLEAYDPSSRYSPALLTGVVECGEKLPSGAHLAAAINGVIAGTTALQSDGSRALYALMTADTALQEGRNRLELLLLSGAPGAPRIEPVELAVARDD